jgi:hypothetical protein
MAVCADDLALRDFVEHALPVAVPQCRSDREQLVAKVVELEHKRIALAAVDAGMSNEVLD